MIDVAPRELPSSITGQRDGALALLVDQRDWGDRLAIFAVWCS